MYNAQTGDLEITCTQAVIEHIWLCDEPSTTPPAGRTYSEELALCQRYYVYIPAAGELSVMGYAFNETTGRFTLNLPVAMRLSNPTLLISYRTNMTIYPQNMMPTSIGSAKIVGTMCAIVLYASGFTPGEVLVCKPNAKIELSCDLL